MKREERERQLRQDIHSLRVTKFGWTVEQFKGLLVYLGMGDSLRALDELTLTELKLILMLTRKVGRPDEYTYDKQGMYMHTLMKRARWNIYDLRTFMITHYKKSHWNLLNKKERRAVIAMLQNYIKQNEKKAKDNKETSNGHTQDPQG